MSRLLTSFVLGLTLAFANASADEPPRDEAEGHDVRAHEAVRDRLSRREPGATLASIDDAARAGAAHGPDTIAARAARRGADGIQKTTTPLLHPPNLELQLGVRHGVFGYGPEVLAVATQEVPMRRLGRARSRYASAETQALDAGIVMAEARAARRAALAFVSTVEAQALLALRDRALEDADRLASLTRRRVEVGTAQPSEAALGESERGRARVGHIEAEGLLTEAAGELALAVGREPTDPPGTPAQFDAAPRAVVIRPGEMAALVDRHPDVRLLVARIKAADASVGVSHAQNGPEALAQLSYQREGGGDQVGLGVVAVDLPVFDPAAFQTSIYRIELAALEGQAALLRSDATKEVYLARHDTEHYLELYEQVTRSVVAPAQEAVRLAERAYLAGTDTLANLLIARQRLVEAEESAIRARAALGRAHIRLAYATGRLGEGP